MASFTVTTVADDEQAPPPGSLRQAIADANVNPGADSIGFAVTGTIVLAAPLPPVTDELDIVGPGADVLAISGANAHRIFTVNPGVTVRVRDLAIREGFDPSNGAGFFNLGNLDLTRCTLANNSVGFSGGGVYTPTDASLTATDCAFIQNSSDNLGAAIHMDGGRALAIRNTRFEANNATSSGAAIWSDTVEPVAITASRFLRNTASASGGAIVLASGSMRVTRSEFSANRATDVFGLGGAIAAMAETVTDISDSTFADNRAGFAGGGLWAVASTVAVSAARMARNIADIAGGAIAVEQAQLRVVGSGCSDNTGGVVGGGAISVDNESSAEITDSAFFRNMAAGSGGAVLNNNSTTMMTNCTIANNSAGTTGGAVHATTGTMALSFVTVADNTVAFGEGIASDTAAIAVKNTIVASTIGGVNCSANAMNLGGNLSTDGSCPGFAVTSRAQLSLGPLQLNPPGTTETMALLPGSVAIDAAVDCSDAAGNPVLTDQRGVARPQGARCDAGAFEAAFAPPGPPPGRVRRAPGQPALFVSDGTCGSQRVRRRNPFLPFTR